MTMKNSFLEQRRGSWPQLSGRRASSGSGRSGDYDCTPSSAGAYDESCVHRTSRTAYQASAVLFAIWALLSISVYLEIGLLESLTHRVAAIHSSPGGDNNNNNDNKNSMLRSSSSSSIATTTTTTTTSNTAPSQEGQLPAAVAAAAARPLLQIAPAEVVAFQDMETACNLKRYPHLFEFFCDNMHSTSCDLAAFSAYFQEHNKDDKAENKLVAGCPVREAICYAKRYSYLLDGYCHGVESKCNYFSLREHYERHGTRFHLAWGCGGWVDKPLRQKEAPSKKNEEIAEPPPPTVEQTPAATAIVEEAAAAIVKSAIAAAEPAAVVVEPAAVEQAATEPAAVAEPVAIVAEPAAVVEPAAVEPSEPATSTEQAAKTEPAAATDPAAAAEPVASVRRAKHRRLVPV
jgi:hypothetical protein